jgi:transcription elongation factor Elf1
MSGIIDRLFINYLSGRLERFKWIRPTVAVCRCPFCGDGRKGQRTRFYIYQDIKHSTYLYNVDCKNCGYQMSFYSFLKTFDPSLFNQYRLEKFRDKHGREPRQMFSEMTQEPEREKTTQVIDTDKLEGAILLKDLPTEHPCVQYVLDRKISEKFLDYLLYTDNFQKLTADFKDPEYAKKIPEDARLVIPFYNEFGVLNCFQGRSLDKANKIRYITVKRTDDAEKTFGMDRIDRSQEVRVVEGPIDSLFVHNCLASADADLTRVKGDVYIYDSQYRNPDVVRHINKAIDKGVKLVLFPKEFHWKDINDAVKDGGLTLNEIENLIRGHTFQGLKAKLEFSKLRGC